MKQLNCVLGKCVLTITMLLLFTSLAPAVHAQCSFSPKGWVVIGPSGSGFYDHIRNGFLKNNGECWDGEAPISTTTCGLSSANVINFNGYHLNRYQDIEVPVENTQTQWELIYSLTANDPHQDGWWTTLEAKVYNMSNNGSMIASQIWRGNDGTLTCSRRTLSFQGNYAGKKLRVYFRGRNPSPADTVIRVGGITLYQYEPF